MDGGQLFNGAHGVVGGDFVEPLLELTQLFQGGGKTVQTLLEGGQVALDGVQIEGEEALGGVQLVVRAGNAGVDGLAQVGEGVINAGQGAVGIRAEAVRLLNEGTQCAVDVLGFPVDGVQSGPGVVSTLDAAGVGGVSDGAQCGVDGGHLLRDAAARAGHLGGQLGEKGCQAAQCVGECLGGVLAVDQVGVRLELPHNAADVLPALDDPVVLTVLDDALLASRDAAGVVARVLVAHSGVVDTAGDGAGGVPGDAAGVHSVLVLGDIDLPLSGAVLNHALVEAGNAAGVQLTGYRRLADTARNPSGDCVVAGDAAHILVASHGAGDGAAGDGAAVLTGDEAQAGPAAAGGEGALRRQVPHHGSGLEVADEALVRAYLCKGETTDSMSCTVEIAAEHGDGGEINAGEVDVRGEHYGQVPGIGVQGAVFGQKRQLGGSGDVKGSGAVFCGPCGRRGREQQPKAQGQRGGQGPDAFTHVPSHRRTPLFPGICSQSARPRCPG